MPFPVSSFRRIALIGAGHTNLHVVRMWMQGAISDASLTLISASRRAAYSGMLPGTLAGRYETDQMLIDLDRLTSTAGVELIVDSAVLVDTQSREIRFSERPAMRYDVCSIGIGSMPRHAELLHRHPGFVSIKPMHSALGRLESVMTAVTSSRIRVTVVGGGAAGVEVAFGITARLHAAGRTPAVTLVEAQPSLVAGFRTRTRRLVQQQLDQRGITVVCNRRAIDHEGLDVLLDDDSRLPSDIVLWVTGASPPALLSKVSLPKSQAGFLNVRKTLQSIGDERVFVVGDSAEIADAQIDRAGVYAVRQGPILWKNLQALLSGQRLTEYQPQRDFLRLLSTGDGRAIAQWKWFSASGPRWWRLKDRIDSRFMKMHRPDAGMRPKQPTDMNRLSAPTPQLMRCRGCGGKTSSRVLTTVLQRLRSERKSIPEGFLQSDDTAQLPTNGPAANSVSVDFFPAFLDDPWLTGRIAAIHALSDLWASGAQPSSAVAMITLPAATHSQQSELLYHVLSGAIRELEAGGAVLTTGHTTDGDELSVGFTVLGHAADGRQMKKSKLRPGQALILTKPLGTGVILAARDQGCGNAAALDAAIEMMLRPNASASRIVLAAGVTAATDVTGFGLAGHLCEMMIQSGVSVEVNLSKIPVLPGALDLLRQGVRSSLHEENEAAIGELLNEAMQTAASGNLPSTLTGECQARRAVIFDPQTSGGLLIAIDEDQAAQLTEELQAAGDHSAAVIGVVTVTAECPSLNLRAV